MECAGRAQRRRRFGVDRAFRSRNQSGVALRLPALPAHSKSTGSRNCILRAVGWAGCIENDRRAADFKSVIRRSAARMAATTRCGFSPPGWEFKV
jgi:hypothetical protein